MTKVAETGTGTVSKGSSGGGMGCAMCTQGTGKAAKMGLMMGLCCILPIIIVGAVLGLAAAGAVELGGLGATVLAFLPILICPLAMGGMMVAMMLKDRKKGAGAKGENGHSCH